MRSLPRRSALLYDRSPKLEACSATLAGCHYLILQNHETTRTFCALVSRCCLFCYCVPYFLACTRDTIVHYCVRRSGILHSILSCNIVFSIRCTAVVGCLAPGCATSSATQHPFLLRFYFLGVQVVFVCGASTCACCASAKTHAHSQGPR